MYTIESRTYFSCTTVWHVMLDGEYLYTCDTYKEAQKMVEYGNDSQGY
jgi:hypothetical protein